MHCARVTPCSAWRGVATGLSAAGSEDARRERGRRFTLYTQQLAALVVVVCCSALCLRSTAPSRRVSFSGRRHGAHPRQRHESANE